MTDNITILNSTGGTITLRMKDTTGSSGPYANMSLPTDTSGNPMLVLSGSAVTSTMSAAVVALSTLGGAIQIGSLSSGTVFVSSGVLATVGTINTISSGTLAALTSLTSGSVVISNGANQAQVLAGSSTVTSTMAALLAAISPNSAGIIATGLVGSPSSQYLSVQGASNASPIPAADPYSTYTVVGASLTQQSLGSSAGRAGDYLAYVTIFPSVAAAGAVTIFDSSSITIGTFAGGATTPLPSLVPFRIDIGAFSQSSGWKVTTSSNVTALGVGKFT